jgi:hypothetical protein
MEEGLLARLTSGRAFRAVTSAGIFRFRVVQFDRATDAIEGRVEWLRAFPGDRNALTGRFPGDTELLGATYGAMSPTDKLQKGVTHRVRGRLQGRTLTYEEYFDPWCEMEFALVFDGDHRLSGKVWYANAQGRGQAMSYAVQMELGEE